MVSKERINHGLDKTTTELYATKRQKAQKKKKRKYLVMFLPKTDEAFMEMWKQLVLGSSFRVIPK